MRTTDNSKKAFESIGKLSDIANIPLNEIKSDKTNLIIFPKDFNAGIEKSYGKYPPIFQYYNNTLITGNIMGFIGCGKTKLTISSRFYSNGNDYFLYYMLSKVFGINLVNLDFGTGKDKIDEILPILLFQSYLQKALKKGIFKQYRRNEYNDSNVKGAININRHIKLNIPFVGKIAYTMREHSHDNNITQLIRHTIEYLRTHSIGHSILTNNADIRTNVSQIEYATPTYKKSNLQKIIRANLRPVNHPYFVEYRDLQTLCLMILRRDSMCFGNKDEIHGLLFDGSWLWEEYLNTFIGSNFQHLANKKNVGWKLFETGDGLVRPDFIDEKSKIIADAKYKPVKNIKGDDYLQILAYMFRFNSEKGYFIYPDTDNNEKLMKLKDSDNIYVYKIGLQIPQYAKNNFKEFKEEMEINEKILKSMLRENSSFHHIFSHHQLTQLQKR